MLLLNTVNYAHVTLVWDRPLIGNSQQRIAQLHGALAQAFLDNDLLHQHDSITGKNVYRYPHVQYRWHNGQGVIVAWGKVAQTVLNLPWLDLKLRLGTDEVQVNTAELKLQHGQFGVSENLLYYCTESPLLLLNQENYKRYMDMNEREQWVEQNRLLVSQMLMSLRALEVRVPERLYAAFVDMVVENCYYKVKRIGVRGVLVTNMVVPDGFACGRGVSHGFGEVRAVW